jgi:hypothetical protein
MLNKYCISIILLLHLFFFQNLFGQKNYEDFAQKYKGMGALSEMIMSHKCIIRKNFNLFYETTIKKSEEDRTLIWYKFVFHQPCFISFTIIPNNENDRYDLEVYKIKNNIKLCNTTVDSIFTKVDSISKKVTYTDDYQSTSFRGSLFTSKQIEVTYNEAIYILVNNLSEKEYDIYLYHDGVNDIQWFEGIRSMTPPNRVYDYRQNAHRDTFEWLKEIDDEF